MNTEMIDMVCGCDECQACLLAGDPTTNTTVTCQACLQSWPCRNLATDIWPLTFDCPRCKRPAAACYAFEEKLVMEAETQQNSDEATLLRIMRHGGHVRSFTYVDGSYRVDWTWEEDGGQTQSGYGRGASFAEAVRDAFSYGGPWDAS